MPEYRCRTIDFAHHRVGVASRGPFAESLVAFSFPGAQEVDESTAARFARFTVDAESAVHHVSIGHAGHCVYDGSSPADAVRFLTEAISFELSSHACGGLLIHAAATASDGGAIIIAGASGSGKTTLAAHLTAAGHSYLTDELVFVDDADPARIDGLCRPLHVKPQGRPYLPAVWSSTRWQTLSGGLATMLRPPAIPQAVAARETRAVVFPRRANGARTSLTRLSKADAAARLMGSLLNARSLDAHGLPAVVAVAGHVPALELAYEDAAEGAACLIGSLAQHC